MVETKPWMAFFAGIGIGAAAGIVLAPQSGQRFRSRIGRLAYQGAEVVKERARNLSDVASETLDRATAKASKAADEVARKSQQAEHSVGKKLEDAGRRLQSA